MTRLRPENGQPRRIAVGRLIMAVILLLGAVACSGPARKPDPVAVTESRRLASQGSYWYARGCHQRAERYFHQALETARLTDDLNGMVRAENNLGATDLAAGRLKEAGEHLDRALYLNLTARNTEDEIQIYVNLGSLAFRSGQASRAEEFWRRAIELAQAPENQTSLALPLNNLAALCRTEGRLATAETLLTQAREVATRQGQSGALATNHHQWGLFFQARGDFLQAEQNLTRALDLDKETENPVGIAQDLEKLGLLCQEQKDWSRAARFLDRAINLRAALGDLERVKAILGFLKNNHALGGQPESLSAYEHLLTDSAAGRSILCR